ncbi:unnamed protein product, partial [Effrenium voratum]
MYAATEEWLQSVAAAVEGVREAEAPVLLCSFAGHGAAGAFFPVDCGRPSAREEIFCFFEDLLFPLLELLGGRLFRRPWQEPVAWLPNVRILVMVESCRRLMGDEASAYQAAKLRTAQS